MVNYKNRYNEIITFKKVEGGVLMIGGTFYRCGLLNDYSKAYEEFLKEGSTCLAEEFEDLMSTDEQTWKTYEKFVVTTDKLHFVDPSGGPFICVGYDLGDIGKEFKNLVVKEIVSDGNDYLLKI